MSRFHQAQLENALLQGDVFLFDEIDSTNEYLLKNHQMLSTGSLCIAETQTAGRGRRGRKWFSPESDNLYFSMLWRYPSAQRADLAPLSLVVAVVIAEAFQALGVQGIQIKWPNDIYFHGKKMGGILIESCLEADSVALVIGIGLNLGMKHVDESVVTQAWADLSHYHFNRNDLAAQLAQGLQRTLQDYAKHGFSAYLARWQAFDLFFNQAVKLVTETAEIHGISQGVNEKGELLLKQGTQLNAFAIGEMSLRAEG